MGKIYSRATVPKYGDPSKSMTLQPDLYAIFAKSRDATELEYYWKAWREATGSKMKALYREGLDLINEAAR